jgi:NAD(P)-dependent dehydrogenase (short-subunit alcohol dehydrogenase family)
MVTRAFVDFLKHGKNARLVNISSALGSLTLRQSTGYYGYNASKAALNMFTRMLAVELSPFGIVTVTVHPGWVQTDMGGRGAPLTPQESVQGLIKLIDGLTASHNGLYYRWDGEALPW